MPTLSARYLLAILSLLVFGLSATAQAQSSGVSTAFDFRKKSEAKKGSRWTLQEWLEQKERNRMMDLWLAMYSPSPYEFYLKGSQIKYDTDDNTGTKNSYSGFRGAIGAYATVLGISIEHENQTEENFSELSGALNLRIAGNAVQGTHLILYAGQRGRNYQINNQSLHLVQNMAGADLNLYFNKYIGLLADYRQLLETDSTELGKVSGNVGKYGLFIDFEALRIFGQLYKEQEKRILNGTDTNIQKQGLEAGLQLFF